MVTATIKEKLCTPSWLTGKAKANSYDGKPRTVEVHTVKWSNARGYNIVGQVFHDPVVKQWQTMAYDADDGTIADAIAAAGLDILQLHGHEPPERAAQVRAQFGLPVWKALPVASAADVASADAYAGATDLVLFDAKTPKGTLPGGMGLSFDWSLVAGWKGPIPWGLAGGLSPENVAEAVRLTGTPLVDTSSGVESAPGVKDVDRIAAFAYAARNS